MCKYLVAILMLFGFAAVAVAQPGTSVNGILQENWRFDMTFYTWGWFGSSPAIADLGVNDLGGEPDEYMEIATGTDEMIGSVPGSMGRWLILDSGGNMEREIGTHTDESRGSLAIVDIDGDGDLEMAGGTTSGIYVQVMDHQGNYVWMFPKQYSSYSGGNFVWPAAPAVGELTAVGDGLEVVEGNRAYGGIYCFEGDPFNDGDEGITITDVEYPGHPGGVGTDGVDWDVLWRVGTGGVMVVASAAIGDVDADGDNDVVVGDTAGTLYVIDGPTGVAQTTPLGVGIYASAALANLDGDPALEIVVGAMDGIVYCIDGATLATQWTFGTGGPVYSSAAVGDVDVDAMLEVVVGSNDGSVYCLDGLTGGLEWSYATGGPVYSSPALASRSGAGTYALEWPMFRSNPCRTGVYGGGGGGMLDIYVGSEDCFLHLLDANGNMIDKFEVFSSGYPGYTGIHTSPSVANVDADDKLDVFFYDWGNQSALGGHTFWALTRQLEIEVLVDHKPASCPSAHNLGKKGVFPTAIVGTDDLDVSMIDPMSIILTVDDGDISGILPVDWEIKDGTEPPAEGEPCFEGVPNTDTDGDGILDTYVPDGKPDLFLYYDSVALDALMTGELDPDPVPGDEVLLVLTGVMKPEYGGVPVWGEDVILITGGPKPKPAPASGSSVELLAGYPIPFNPEVWMPYKLHQDVAVKITVYNAMGQLVRTLELGYKPAGDYVDKSKAAYWDGRNESGELVSSGIYFYTFQAGDFVATKKLVMIK